MIPLAVELEGFLSFRDAERLEFARPGVALLHGHNAAGKSTIFDAILCALFGGHRGGEKPTADLIHKGCDRAKVAFEFQLGRERYRAVRDLERATDPATGKESVKHTPHLYHWQRTKAGDDWVPVRQATKITDFKKRIDELIGLSYEAFTASVLLMQDRARVLVSQDLKAPEHRFEVLARLVGLSFYQQFHKKVDDHRLEQGREVRRLEAELKGVAAVKPEELAAVADQIDAAAADVEAAAAAVAAQTRRQARAEEWSRLDGQRAAEQAKWDAAERLLGDAAAVERDGQWAAELTAVLPVLRKLHDHRGAKARAEGEAARLKDQGDAEKQKAAAAQALLDQVLRRLAELDEAQAAQEDQRRTDSDRQRELDQALRPLRRLLADRRKLLAARKAYAELQDQAKQADALVQQRQTAVAALEEECRTADEADRTAEMTVVRADAALTALAERAARFDAVKGEPTCSFCGQDLGPEHIAKEKAELERLRAELQAAADTAAAARKLTAAAKADTAQRLRDAKRDHDQAGTAAQGLQTQLTALRQEGKGLAEALAAAYAELAPAWRERVARQPPADWAKTTYPTADDLAAVEQELAQVNDRLAALAQQEQARRTETAKLRHQKVQAEKDRETLDQKVNATAVALARAQEAATAEARAADGALALLPSAWQAKAAALTADRLRALDAESQQLAGAVDRWKELERARAGRDALRQRLDDLAAQLAAFTDDERCHPDVVARELAAARSQEQECRDRRSRLDAAKRALEERRDRRNQLELQKLQADRSQAVAAKLERLLDESNLQRHILRDRAEDAVIANANAVLEKLMGGQLRLCRAADEKGKALQLEAEFLATGQRRSLTFLSGSEQFRVAISLALGLGQFASRGQKPIEAVIIDEGFGCLDQNNRRLMIEEIRRLQGELKCILLVSHQEEFAEAFPAGYRFTIEDGTSRVSRIG